MSEEKSLPAPDAILADLKATGSGAKKLETISSWISRPVLWDSAKRAWTDCEGTSENLLLWAEDLHQMDNQAIGEGTLTKIGQRVVGEAYGIRRPGETNSDEIGRLRARVNELEKQLDMFNRGQSQSATRAVFIESRCKSLEDENLALRNQVELLNRTLYPPDLQASKEPETANMPPRHTRTGVQPKPRGKNETVGPLAEAAT